MEGRERNRWREGEIQTYSAAGEVAASVSFCVPHGFIPFCRPFIHTPSLAHSVIVMPALSHSSHPFLLSALRLFTLALFFSPPRRPLEPSLLSLPSPHLCSTPLTSSLPPSLLCLCFIFFSHSLCLGSSFLSSSSSSSTVRSFTIFENILYRLY